MKPALATPSVGALIGLAVQLASTCLSCSPEPANLDPAIDADFRTISAVCPRVNAYDLNRIEATRRVAW